MKREIKFEVCIRRKDGSDLYYETLTLDDLLNRNGSLYNPSVQEIVYKREFTGLLDKNGKETYEGDIVSYKWEDRDNVFEIVNHIIKWIDGKFLMCPIKSDIRTWNIHISPYITESEVIGNLFETPELLNQ